jgi:peptidoglycan biosynthesis protein MviN/MurJ (putative lipid II flippase)
MSYYLSQPDRYGVVGLAISQSIIAFIEVLILSMIMSRKDKKLFDRRFFVGLLRILATTGLTIIVASVMVTIIPLDSSDRGLTLTAKLSIISFVILSAHLAFSWAMNLQEAKPVTAKIKRLVLRPIKIQ